MVGTGVGVGDADDVADENGVEVGPGEVKPPYTQPPSVPNGIYGKMA